MKLLRISRGAPKNKRFQRLKLIPGVAESIQRTEEAFMRDKAMWEADADLLYIVEEKHRTADLTEKGRDLLAREEPDKYVLADQFNSEANWRAHYDGTGREIWEATGGKVNVVVLTMSCFSGALVEHLDSPQVRQGWQDRRQQGR